MLKISLAGRQFVTGKSHHSVPETQSAASTNEMRNPSPSTADDTQTLLSLFQSNDEFSLSVNANENDNDLKIGKRTGRPSKNVAPSGEESS
ncbi:hypothetical protein [Photorhabdus viridis]|uniref:hypothetical protein n=1 Tax=Photorhabdus viridis TaxID=3163327 RepID=UPI0033079E20